MIVFSKYLALDFRVIVCPHVGNGLSSPVIDLDLLWVGLHCRCRHRILKSITSGCWTWGDVFVVFVGLGFCRTKKF